MKRLLVVLLVLLAACSENPAADIPRIEGVIAQGIKDQGGFTAKVNCPSSIEWRTGGEFRCIAKASGERAVVVVHMENDNGDITWEVD